MCEIFPDINKCCLCVPVRIALLFIAIFAIMTGAFTQCLLTKGPIFSFTTVLKVLMSLTLDLNQILNSMHVLVNVAVSGIAIIFMALGMLLLVSNLLDAQEMVLIFVWGITLSVAACFLLIAGVTAQCMVFENQCMLSGMDWFSGALLMVMLIGYLILWLYFAAVGNTYSSGQAD